MASQLHFLLRLSLFTNTKARLCSKLSVMENTLQNTKIAQAQALAEAKGAKQLVICKTSRGVNYLSKWDIKEVLEFLMMKVEEEKAVRKA